jgi:hypothetical protein
MTSADVYFAQADRLRERAEACRQLADELDAATLFDLHNYSGEATWQGPVAIEFDERVSGYCFQLTDAIERLRSNALALGCEADDLERQGAVLLATAQAS